MDANGIPASADPEVEAVQARIEKARHDLSETIEALVYKTDVPARTSDALAEGIASVQEGLETAKESAALAFEEVAERVPVSTRRKLVYGALGIVACAVAASFLRRRRPKPGETIEVDDLLLIDASDLESLPLE